MAYGAATCLETAITLPSLITHFRQETSHVVFCIHLLQMFDTLSLILWALVILTAMKIVCHAHLLCFFIECSSQSSLLKPAKDGHSTLLPASTSSVQATIGLPEVPTLLLDAIEHAQCDMVGGVTGRVVRVYRRKGEQLIKTVQHDHKDNQQ